MIILRGKLVNLFVTPKGKNKSGDAYGGEDKLQIINQVSLQNGEQRLDLISITVPDANEYKDLKGKDLDLPIDVYSYQNKVGFRLAQ